MASSNIQRIDRDGDYFDSGHGDAPTEELDLSQYIRIIRKNRWLIFSLTAVVTALSIWYVLTATPIFKATATLLIENQKQGNVISIEELYGVDGSGAEYYQTQFEILKSRELAEKIVAKLDLGNHREFNQEGGGVTSLLQQKSQELISAMDGDVGGANNTKPVSTLQAVENLTDEEYKLRVVTNDFMHRLSVEPVRKTQLVKIHFEAADPELAALVANTVGEAYIENYLDAKMEMTSKAAAWLTERLAGLREKLDASEQKLIEFRDKNQLVDIGGDVTRVSATELGQTSSKLIDARRELAEAQSLYRQVASLKNAPLELLESVSAVQRSQLVSTYKIERARAQRELDELSNRYGSRHPKIVDARSRLNVAEQSLRTEINRIIAGIEKDYELARQKVSSLSGAVSASKREIQKIGKKTFELERLQREVEANRNLYDTFFNRIRETDEASGLEKTNARISDPALPPLAPSKPKKSLIVALGFILGLIGSVALAFLRELMDDSITGAEDVEHKLKSTMLGVVPLVKDRKSGKGKGPVNPLKINDKRGTFVESIKTIRSSLTVHSSGKDGKVFLVTSSVPGEGKSTISLNLAFAMSQLEKTLLIDADMRRPTIGKAVDLDRGEPGLSNLIRKDHKAQECIHSNVLGDLDVIPCGDLPDDPLELLASKRMSYVLDQLKRHYDRIIIDCAPMQAVSDAIVLSPNVDGIVYAVKSHDTPMDIAKRGISRLKQIAAPLKGVVVTQLDVDKIKSYGGDYYYQGYYDYYGYSSANSNQKSKKSKKKPGGDAPKLKSA